MKITEIKFVSMDWNEQVPIAVFREHGKEDSG
jgi:hypothetical protein